MTSKPFASDKAHATLNLFLHLAKDTIHNNSMTKMKVLRLVYAAQGYNLAMLKQPLFTDSIMAWPNGPMVTKLYKDIAKQFEIVKPVYYHDYANILSLDEQDIIWYTWQDLGYQSGSELRNTMCEYDTP